MIDDREFSKLCVGSEDSFRSAIYMLYVLTGRVSIFSCIDCGRGGYWGCIGFATSFRGKVSMEDL